MQYSNAAPRLKFLAIAALALFPSCSLALGNGSNKAVTQEMRSLQNEVRALRSEVALLNAAATAQHGAEAEAGFHVEHKALEMLLVKRAEMSLSLVTIRRDFGTDSKEAQALQNSIHDLDAQIKELEALVD